MITATNLRPVVKNTLTAFCDFQLEPSGLLLRECSLHCKNGKRWVGFPGKPQVGVTAEGGDLAGHDLGESPGPELWVQQDRLGLLEEGWVSVLEIEQLNAEVQAERQGRGERGGERIA